MASRVLMLILLVNVVCGIEEKRRDGLMDRLSSGMKLAQGFLGSESVALKVAEFVVRAFNTANNPRPYSHPAPTMDTAAELTEKRPIADISDEEQDINDEYKRPHFSVNEAPSAMAPMRHLVRLFGLQPNQISAVAVNALVFVAQMISSFLSGPQRPRPYRHEDTTSWLLNKNSRRLQDLLDAAKNESLPENIEQLIKEQGTDEETSCIRLLVCKITPFVTKMQAAVFGPEEMIDMKGVKGAAMLYKHLPSSEEINERSSLCEKKHMDCNLNE